MICILASEEMPEEVRNFMSGRLAERGICKRQVNTVSNQG
jgi:hypothetical protein